MPVRYWNSDGVPQTGFFQIRLRHPGSFQSMFENTSKCEDCLYYEYDDEYGFYVCDMDLDEDETAQFIGGRFQNCPYYRPGDEYTIVRKQI